MAALYVSTIEGARSSKELPEDAAEDQYTMAAVGLADVASEAWARSDRTKVIAILREARRHPMLRVESPRMWLHLLRIVEEELPGFPLENTHEAGPAEIVQPETVVHPDSPSTPAGWYPDPWRAAELRYWDGAEWTGHVTTAGG